MDRERIKIEGMSCGHCVASVKKALESLNGVTEIRVDLEGGEASFVRSGAVAREVIERAVEEAGYGVVDQTGREP
jgi:copper chaperone CopZ